MVEDALTRPPQARIEVERQRVGDGFLFAVRLTNLSGVTLGADNAARLHAIVYEEAHVADTDRFVRAAGSVAIAALAPGETGSSRSRSRSRRWTGAGSTRWSWSTTGPAGPPAPTTCSRRRCNPDRAGHRRAGGEPVAMPYLAVNDWSSTGTTCTVALVKSIVKVPVIAGVNELRTR